MRMHKSIDFDRKTFEKEALLALEAIKKASNITILTHKNPDGDAISCCAALDRFLEKLGKKNETIYPSSPEFEYKRYAKNILINRHIQH